MKHTIFSLILLFISTSIFAARKEILLNENWMFRFSHQVQFKSEERVNLPHTWNSGDALSGKQDYYRGMGNYTKTLFVKPEWKGKRLFLRFEGVNTIANVFINDVHIGEHRGGYGAFVFEITDKVKYDADNRILVKVNNALQQDVMPLVGDFNFYGGIYRDVNLIITDPVNISLTDYASPGVYLIQHKETKEQADEKAKVLVSNGSATAQPVKVDIKIWEDGKLVQQQDIKVTVDANDWATTGMDLTIRNPRLWNGRKDPFMYKAEISLHSEGQIIDRIVQPLGLRYYHVDAEEGFFLNGEKTVFKGVCNHHDLGPLGAAVNDAAIRRQIRILKDMGCNAIRTSHNMPAPELVKACDEMGMMLMAESFDEWNKAKCANGYNLIFDEWVEKDLVNLVHHYRNNPSVVMWCVGNEVPNQWDERGCMKTRFLQDI